MAKDKNNFVGSVVVKFVISCVVFAVVIAGSVYYLKWRSEQANRVQTVASESDDNVNSSEEVEPTEKSDDTTAEEYTDTVNQLPATGADDLLSVLFSTGALVSAIVAYLLSRHERVVRSL